MNPSGVKKARVRDRSSGVILREQFIGPIPPPQVLAGYEEILPGSANRILQLAEKQSKHRQKLESSVISSNIFHEKLGMIFAFIVTSLVVGGGVYLVSIGKELVGFVTLAGTVLLHFMNYASQKRQEQEKANSSHRE